MVRDSVSKFSEAFTHQNLCIALITNVFNH